MIFSTSILSRLKRTGFRGGLPLEPNKQSLEGTIRQLPLPQQLLVPLLSYSKQPLPSLVSIGQPVNRGQPIAYNIAAPASGTVSSIEKRAIIHPGSLEAMCVVIDVDNRDDTPEHTTPLVSQSQDALSYIKGLGGAAYPLQDKLDSLRGKRLHTLIINGAECEPDIACDEALMQHQPDEIIYGVKKLLELLTPQRCILAIEDSKTNAVETIRAALKISDEIELRRIETRYPTGAERPLIQVITGQIIEHYKHPGDYGILCMNIATAHAVGEKLRNRFADSRIITVTGSQARQHCNVRARFGSSIEHVLKHSGNWPIPEDVCIRVGGPLSGFNVGSAELPITPQTNCIMLEQHAIKQAAQPCIRCGDCETVCPMSLLPQQLHWYAQADNLDYCSKLNLDACIECGCCDVVCPSGIALTNTFRYAKARQNDIQFQATQSALAEQRFEAREARVNNKAIERASKLAERKKSLNQDSKDNSDTDIQATLARIKARKKDTP